MLDHFPQIEARTDEYSIRLESVDFVAGGLNQSSRIRPNRLFTARSGSLSIGQAMYPRQSSTRLWTSWSRFSARTDRCLRPEPASCCSFEQGLPHFLEPRPAGFLDCTKKQLPKTTQLALNRREPEGGF